MADEAVGAPTENELGDARPDCGVVVVLAGVRARVHYHVERPVHHARGVQCAVLIFEEAFQFKLGMEPGELFPVFLGFRVLGVLFNPRQQSGWMPRPSFELGTPSFFLGWLVRGAVGAATEAWSSFSSSANPDLALPLTRYTLMTDLLLNPSVSGVCSPWAWMPPRGVSTR